MSSLCTNLKEQKAKEVVKDDINYHLLQVKKKFLLYPKVWHQARDK